MPQPLNTVQVAVGPTEALKKKPDGDLVRNSASSHEAKPGAGDSVKIQKNKIVLWAGPRLYLAQGVSSAVKEENIEAPAV